jgi:hypothetical protein
MTRFAYDRFGAREVFGEPEALVLMDGGANRLRRCRYDWMLTTPDCLRRAHRLGSPMASGRRSSTGV